MTEINTGTGRGARATGPRHLINSQLVCFINPLIINKYLPPCIRVAVQQKCMRNLFFDCTMKMKRCKHETCPVYLIFSTYNYTKKLQGKHNIFKLSLPGSPVRGIHENYLITCVQREKSRVTYVTARKITGINHVAAGAQGGDDFPFAIFYVGIILIYFRT